MDFVYTGVLWSPTTVWRGGVWQARGVWAPLAGYGVAVAAMEVIGTEVVSVGAE